MNVGRRLRGRSRNRSWTCTKWRTAKEEHAEAEVCLWSGDEYEEARKIECANGVKTVGQGSSLGSVKYHFQRIQSVKEGFEVQQSGEGYDTKIEADGRMDANSSWWVSELLAVECPEAWLHAGFEDTMQKWYDWLGEMKKKDEARGEQEKK